jgi:hypothetical protein
VRAVSSWRARSNCSTSDLGGGVELGTVVGQDLGQRLGRFVVLDGRQSAAGTAPGRTQEVS